MKVLITGSSGLVGSALVEFLREHGHDVIPLRRTGGGDGAPFWDPECGVIDLGGVTGIDAVVHLAGYNIASGRWTTSRKARILESRVRGTQLLSEFFAASTHKPRVIISASGIGAYGECGDTLVDESHERGQGFLAEVCARWEAATTAAVEAEVRVVHIRLGMVLSASGGALHKMLPPFKMGFGGVMGSGAQFMSWVSIVDVVNIIQFIMEDDSMRGSVNGVSPVPVNNYEFTKTLGRVLHRPTFCRMPACVVRLLFGEMGRELLLSSTRARPGQLINAGYSFQHTELSDALRSVL